MESKGFPRRQAIEDSLKQNGFKYWAAIYGMELDLFKYSAPASETPPGFEIAAISLQDRASMDKLHSIAASNFLAPAEQDYKPTLVSMRRNALEEPYYLYFIGKSNGEAVATISISFKHAFAGVAQISDVTTLPSHRGRGYASALLKFAIVKCKSHGFQWVVLQGEQDGPMKLYQSLGFVTSCQIDVWEKPSPE